MALFILIWALFVAWPVLWDLWHVRKLRTEPSLLQTVLSEPGIKFPRSALEKYLETEHGKYALFELYIETAEKELPRLYRAEDFLRANFCIVDEKISTAVYTRSKNTCSGGKLRNSESQRLLRAIQQHLGKLEYLEYERETPSARRFTVLPAGEAAKRTGKYYTFDAEGSTNVYIMAWKPFAEEGKLPEKVTERDIQILNKGYALLVERNIPSP